jgi:hypothetical protein
VAQHLKVHQTKVQWMMEIRTQPRFFDSIWILILKTGQLTMV